MHQLLLCSHGQLNTACKELDAALDCDGRNAVGVLLHAQQAAPAKLTRLPLLWLSVPSFLSSSAAAAACALRLWMPQAATAAAPHAAAVQPTAIPAAAPGDSAEDEEPFCRQETIQGVQQVTMVVVLAHSAEDLLTFNNSACKGQPHASYASSVNL
jgi:hypothetical protein